MSGNTETLDALRTGAAEAGSTAPLTYGQMSVWRDIAAVPRHRWHEANFTHDFELPAPVSGNQVSQALIRLCAKHHSLRTVYDVADRQNPQQRLLPPPTVPDLEIAYCTESELAQLIDGLASRPFDLATDRQIRALAVGNAGQSPDPDEPNLTRIVLCVHHMACDAWSMGLLKKDLIAFLGGGEEVPQAEDSLLAVGQEQRTAPSWQRKLRATQRHFRAVFEAGTTNFRDSDPSAEALQASIGSGDLLEPVQALVASHKVSGGSVFTAAFVDAVAAYCDPGPVRLGLMTSNRFQQRWHHLVTSMNQLIPISVDCTETADFAQRLAQVQVIAMRAYQLGHYDVDQVTPAALGLCLDASQLKSICTLNVVRQSPAEIVGSVPAGQPARLEWEPVFSRISVGCYLRVLIGTDGMTRLRLRTGGLAPEVTAGILHGTYQRIMDS